jgi:GMP synthase (glutamine-hydrolysing)
MNQRPIIVLDLGSQTTNLIARRIRHLGVKSEVLPCTTSAKAIKELNPYGIILSGSPFSVTDESYPKVDKDIFSLGIPILGICYGLYLVVEHLKGVVTTSKQKEYGSTRFNIKKPGLLFSGIKAPLNVWMNHGCKALAAPGAELIGSTKSCKFAAFSVAARKLYAVQFHPEVVHTQQGLKILSNFLFRICKAEKNWELSTWAKDKIADIKAQIGSHKAVCGVSGGVDSTVAAILAHRAIGKNLTCIFVNTGLLRQNEVEEVTNLFKAHKLNFRVVDAEERFIKNLRGASDPEQKRKIIGREYIRVFEEEAEKIGKVEYLIQGTIYSDKIESSTTSHLSSNIKSHHNVGGLPDIMRLKLCEPLEFLFKDEVREVGLTIGLSKEMVGRHPFPGPGLAIQIMGEVTREKIDIVRHADHIVLQEIRKAKLYDKVGEIFTNFTGVRTTGVKGDERAYEWLIALRSVDKSDLMTCDWSRLPYDLLAKISSRITNEVPHVNRVVYDITTKPPATIRWE